MQFPLLFPYLTVKKVLFEWSLHSNPIIEISSLLTYSILLQYPKNYREVKQLLNVIHRSVKFVLTSVSLLQSKFSPYTVPNT